MSLLACFSASGKRIEAEGSLGHLNTSVPDLTSATVLKPFYLTLPGSVVDNSVIPFSSKAAHVEHCEVLSVAFGLSWDGEKAHPRLSVLPFTTHLYLGSVAETRRQDWYHSLFGGCC